jgi:hypothetical protein
VTSLQGWVELCVTCSKHAYRSFLLRTGILVSLRRLRDGHRINALLRFSDRIRLGEANIQLRLGLNPCYY